MSSRRPEREENSAVPRALIHKKILEAAETHPRASIEALTDEVAGASKGLVERVLDEYGDPSAPPDDQAGVELPDAVESTADDDATADDSPPAKPDERATMSDASSHDSHGHDRLLDDLTEQQRDILDAIRDRPNATQGDLAESFDVSQATISTHLNAIDGFDWSERGEFLAALPPDPEHESAVTTDHDDGADQPPTVSEARADTTTGPDGPSPDPSNDPASNPNGNAPGEPTRVADGRLEELESVLAEHANALSEHVDRLAELEGELDELEPGCGGDGRPEPLDDADLVARVIRACVDADTIDADEEVELIKHLTTAGHRTD